MKFISILSLAFFSWWLFSDEKGNATSVRPESSVLESQEQEEIPSLSLRPAPRIKPGVEVPSGKLADQFDAWFNPCNDFADSLLVACDYQAVRRTSVGLLRPENTGELNLGMVADIFDFLLTAWEYVPDPNGDDTAYPASESLRLLRGDCEDFAVLTASMLWAISAEVRIYCGQNEEGGHCFAEVNLGTTDMDSVGEYLQGRYDLSSSDKLFGHTDSQGNFWLSLDRAAYPGGHCDRYDEYFVLYPQRRHCENH